MLLMYPADRPEHSRILSIEKSPITQRFPEGIRGIAGDALRGREGEGLGKKKRIDGEEVLNPGMPGEWSKMCKNRVFHKKHYFRGDPGTKNGVGIKNIPYARADSKLKMILKFSLFYSFVRFRFYLSFFAHFRFSCMLNST